MAPPEVRAPHPDTVHAPPAASRELRVFRLMGLTGAEELDVTGLARVMMAASASRAPAR